MSLGEACLPGIFVDFGDGVEASGIGMEHDIEGKEGAEEGVGFIGEEIFDHEDAAGLERVEAAFQEGVDVGFSESMKDVGHPDEIVVIAHGIFKIISGEAAAARSEAGFGEFLAGHFDDGRHIEEGGVEVGACGEEGRGVCAQACAEVEHGMEGREIKLLRDGGRVGLGEAVHGEGEFAECFGAFGMAAVFD